MFRKIIYIATALHLSIIFATIVHGLDDNFYNHFEKPLACLTAINYSAWRFAFFTPDVGKSTEVEIILEGADGKMKRYNTSKDFKFFTSNWESENRFYGFKVHAAKDSAYQDLSSRSMCTRMLNLHQDMHRINYSMKGIQYPKMADFVQDSIIKTGVFYETKFELY
ncbi:MAG: hypothetical protein IPJ74_06125 [Saprospiraceae bacterium]|nr:hypothetical protein [Saprospiraceae bacterium]